MTQARPVSVFWFRRDLRLHDNHGLYVALTAGRPVVPIFIFDRNILERLENSHDPRVTLSLDRLAALDRELRESGSALHTYYGTPLQAFQAVIAEFPVAEVFTNRDYEPYAIARDAQIADFLKSRGIAMQGFKDQCIFEKDEILSSTGTPYTVFTPYKNKWLATLCDADLASFDCTGVTGNFIKTATAKPIHSAGDIGFERAREAFIDPALDTGTIRQYDRKRDFPALEATSRLGPALRFGTVSIRQLARRARELNATWFAQLIWRDFYMQILYHFPHVAQSAFRPSYDAIVWRDDEADFERWCRGTTGYPIVDAGMRQLNQTGYMHNRVRMITAGFLCKHLLIDWRWGEAYFAARLLDFDLAANNGNWQWAAGTGCDAAPYFRVFNPWTQAKKFDPDQAYVKRWVPELLTPDYPSPMIEHAFARIRAIQVYRSALKQLPATESEPELPF